MSGRGALAALLIATVVGACAPKYVIVPDRREGYAERDTLYGRLKGRDIRVTFHHDTTWRVDTVTQWRTIYERGAQVDTVVVVDARRPDGRPGVGPGGRRYGTRVDTVFVVVHDTVRVYEPRRPGSRVDTVRVAVHDTVRIGGFGRPGARVDTVRVVVHDTVRVTEPGRPGRPGGPGGPIVMPPPQNLGHVDTVRIIVHDTIRVNTRDTVRIVVHDTVRVGGNGGGEREGEGHGRQARPRTTMIPPGQYPPTGQCRVWIAGTPPGQQARPVACDNLGTIPAGAFVLFNAKVWDADYDWTTDPDAAHVPPEILAIARRRFH